MSPELEKRIAALAEDRQSGASEILAQAIEILYDSFAAPADLPAVAQALIKAQPAMAPMWNAALTALAARDWSDEFTRFAERVSRAPSALSRFAAEAFQLEGNSKWLSVTTISYSRSVLHVLEALARTRPVFVQCSEGRPLFEGRRLASRLATAGIRVLMFTDAAIGYTLGDADAVLVGADAVTPDTFLNKCGTFMLAAAANHKGIPVYVAASREKFVSPSVAERLYPGVGPPEEVWKDPPQGVSVFNRYFEFTPLELVTTVITDFGLLGSGAVRDVCLAAPKLLPSLTKDPYFPLLDDMPE